MLKQSHAVLQHPRKHSRDVRLAGAPNPVGRVRCLLHELSDNARYSSGHRRLAVRRDTKKLVAPAIVQTREQFDHRLGNIVGEVSLKERQDDQMKVVELASDTNAKTHVEK
ncbi:unnamed protein product [Sphagnum jensenii]|uniref:Uncharacterized protein n=1 Tax=Sphagnum jensenii TaxID=128206 RepID=A0ABP1A2S3_9BRYO